jgi:predicted AlkP superfamily pyrophosphatase or phosphodiesterase
MKSNSEYAGGMIRSRRFFTNALFLSLAAGQMAGQPAGQRALLLISIDGMRPDYVTAADQHGLKIPNLRRVMAQGAHASGVRGVLPTVTYPSHTTILTGVWPVKHGIFNNLAFDPAGTNFEGWYWYSEDIHVTTLWEAAAKAGYRVGSVSWPVSVGAPGVSDLIPEYWRATTSDDLKLLRAISTPGLIREFEGELGPYIVNLEDAIPSDTSRTAYSEAIILHKYPRLMTVHLAALDELEHETGPFSSQSNGTLEQIDGMVGRLDEAMRRVNPGAAICIVSDHGFARIDHQFCPRVALVKAGLMTPNAHRDSLRSPAVTEWKAASWESGGSAMVVLKDPHDQATRGAVAKLLRELAADPANGIAGILDRDAIAKLGGSAMADFSIDMKPGYSIGTAMTGPLVREIQPGGTHGYAPTHPEMLASFFIAGPGIRAGMNAGEIDMRSIAPTLAKYLGASLPSADLPPLEIF